MRKAILFIPLLLCLSFLSHAQLGRLKNVIKETKKDSKKEEKKESPEDKKTSTEQPNDVAKKETTKKEEKIAPDQPNDGITSPMHEKYMGKIVFGTTMESIEFKKEKEDEFVTKANFGDEIRYRVYMDNSLVNYLKSLSFAGTHGRYKIKFYIDGVEAGTEFIQADYFSSDEKKSMTTFKGALKSAPGKRAVGEAEFLRFSRKQEDKFTIGDHKLKIEYIPYQDYPSVYEGPVVASGEITLSVKKSIVDPNDEKTCLPKAMMVDKPLEASIIKAFKAQGWEEKEKEVRIISNKWNIVRNKHTGIITSRYVEAVIGSTKGEKCAYQTFNFYQDHDGSSYQKEVYLSGIGDKRDVSCSCFKK